MTITHRPNDLASFWMPFTANRQFKKSPRMFVAADRMRYKTDDGRTVLDGTAGLWCCNAGHNRPKIVEAIRQQAGELDYAPAFQMGHPKAFEFANRLVAMAPDGFDHVFFTNSGSESVDTALKMALAYHTHARRGPAHPPDRPRARLSRRQFRRHVGRRHRRKPQDVRPDAARRRPHPPHPRSRPQRLHTRGVPEHGAEFADELERICTLHDPSTIAAVIVEPMAGSTGVLIPPKGYLERLRAICDRHGILLIFDEVITGFGRLGTPFAVDFFGVKPDLFTIAKGMTNGVIPMGGVFVQGKIHDAFMNGPEQAIEFAHGYTYSGNPIACAAGIATLDTYAEEGLLTRGAELGDYWADALHSLKGLPHVVDVRNLGLIGAVELEPIAGEPTKRAFSCFLDAFESDLLIRTTGDIIALSPPLIIEKSDIDELFGKLAAVLKRAA